MSTRSRMGLTSVSCLVALIAAVSVGACDKGGKGSSTPGGGGDAEPVMCTADAKICPDGTAVGREGPNCEFAPCPTQDSAAVACTKDAKVCPDGTAVGREGPDCEFAQCPAADGATGGE